MPPRKVFFGGLMSLTILTIYCTASPSSSTHTTAPGQKYDLSSFKLQTCVKDPSEVKADKLKTYHDDHFYLDGDGSIVFKVPDKGETTQNSKYSRYELRETGVSDWKLSGVHVLKVTMKLKHVASKHKETTIAQIHGSAKDDERAMLLRLNWEDGKIVAHCKKKKDGKYKDHILPGNLGEYKMGEELKYEVKIDGKHLTVTVNGRSVSYHDPPVASGDKFYFKAGNYNQCNAACDSHDYAEVHMTAVTTEHNESRSNILDILSTWWPWYTIPLSAAT